MGTRTSHTTPPPIVVCPSCKGNSVFAPSNRWRPFCCERCKDHDLGAWASESFRVASTAPAADDTSADDLPDNLH